jgi:hypothetical protein
MRRGRWRGWQRTPRASGTGKSGSVIRDPAMNDAPAPSPEDAKGRAARYRARTFEVRKEAVAISWAGLKMSFLQIAVTYDVLARQ